MIRAGLVRVVLVLVVLLSIGDRTHAFAGTPELQALFHSIGGVDPTLHLRELQRIAEENGGHRSLSSPGYLKSLDYLEAQARALGLTTSRTLVKQPVYERGTGALAATTLGGRVVESFAEADFATFDFVESATVLAPVTSVDLQLGIDNKSTSGCEASDFQGFPRGTIALLQRGTCPFYLKAKNAEAAGAVAALIMNQGRNAETQGVLRGVPIDQNEVKIPVIFLSYALGVRLAGSLPESISLQVVGRTVYRDSYNLIAETLSGDTENVIMIGAHLDSVEKGPGINDNGSGSATIIEVARALAKQELKYRVRFGWWALEEVGLLGSGAYVQGLTEPELRKIRAYLNFDMVGSPNYIFGVYDGDGSVSDKPMPAGSETIEALFTEFYRMAGKATVEIKIDDRSDHGPFLRRGVPTGGIFSGAEGLKTADEARSTGGSAVVAYDRCYHGACDTFENINLEALEINARAALFSTKALATGMVEIQSMPLRLP